MSGKPFTPTAVDEHIGQRVQLRRVMMGLSQKDRGGSGYVCTIIRTFARDGRAVSEVVIGHCFYHINFKNMVYSQEVNSMCCVAKGPNHGPAPIPEEGKWIQAKEIKDISGLTHGIGWCAPQQGACKLTLNVKEGVIQEALVETIGCSGMTHSAAMASEILPGKTILEALNTDLVCDAINTAMRELFLQIVYGRTQSAFSEGGLMIGAGLEDLGKGLRSQVGTLYGTLAKGPRYLEMAEGYIKTIALDKDNQICGYEFVHMGKFMEEIKKGTDANEALKKVTGTYGRFTAEQGAVKHIDPRHE